MPDVEISKTDQTALIEAVRDKAGQDMPVWLCFAGYYSICIESIITPLSRAIYSRYIASNCNRNESYKSSLELPAIYAQGCIVIENEVDRIQTYRKEMKNGKK